MSSWPPTRTNEIKLPQKVEVIPAGDESSFWVGDGGGGGQEVSRFHRDVVCLKRCGKASWREGGCCLATSGPVPACQPQPATGHLTICLQVKDFYSLLVDGGL